MTRVQRDLFVKNAQETDPWLWRMWAMHVLTGLRPGEVYALPETDLLGSSSPRTAALTFPATCGSG